MWQLFHIMPLILQDKVPFDDEHFSCFMVLQDISALVCADSITQGGIALLRCLIQDYLEQFVSLYSVDRITPKCHYLVHFPALISR